MYCFCLSIDNGSEENWREMMSCIICIVFAFQLIRAKEVRIDIEVKRSDVKWWLVTFRLWRCFFKWWLPLQRQIIKTKAYFGDQCQFGASIHHVHFRLAAPFKYKLIRHMSAAQNMHKTNQTSPHTLVKRRWSTLDSSLFRRSFRAYSCTPHTWLKVKQTK